MADAAGLGFFLSAPPFAIPSAVAYAAGDLVANNGTAALVVPLKFKVGRESPMRAVTITRARLRKTGVTTANGAFRLHLFSTDPTGTLVGGDNAALQLAGMAPGYLGYIDIAAMQTNGAASNLFSDGAAGHGAPGVGQTITARPLKGDSLIYGLLEARAAYAPTNGETVEVSLEGYAD